MPKLWGIRYEGDVEPRVLEERVYDARQIADACADIEVENLRVVKITKDDSWVEIKSEMSDGGAGIPADVRATRDHWGDQPENRGKRLMMRLNLRLGTTTRVILRPKTKKRAGVKRAS